MKPKFHVPEVVSFLPSESSLLRMKKAEIIDWLYCACRNWEKAEDQLHAYAEHMTKKIHAAQHPDDVVFDDKKIVGMDYGKKPETVVANFRNGKLVKISVCNDGDCERRSLGAEPCPGCQFCDEKGDLK